MQKKLLGTLLTLCMLLGVLMAMPAAAADVTEIATADDLVKLMNGELPLDGSYKLTADIDLTGKTQAPITPFTGTFDGNGKTISGVNITGDANVGLFGKVTGTVQNLTAEGTVSGSGSNLGGVIGFADASAKITNCVNECAVTGTAKNTNIGGVVGRAEGAAYISYCINKGTVNGYKQMGGIVGGMKDDVIISACWNAGTITVTVDSGTANTGGIVGYVGGSDNRIYDCMNTGTINAAATRVGGIAGAVTASAAEVTNSYSDATLNVSATSDVGDIYGYASGTVANCYSSPVNAANNFSKMNTNGLWIKTVDGPQLKFIHEQTHNDGETTCDACTCDHTEVFGVTFTYASAAQHTCECGALLVHDLTYDAGAEVHYCSICDTAKEHAAEHSFSADSQCDCGITKLTLRGLDMQNGKIVPTFSLDVSDKAITLKIANTIVSDDNTQVIASGFSITGSDAGDYMFVADDSIVITADADDYVTVTIKCVCDGEEIYAAATEQFIIGFAYVLSAPAVEGYTFDGWSVDNPYTAPSTNSEVTATYTKDYVEPAEPTENKNAFRNRVVAIAAVLSKNNKKCTVSFKSTGAGLIDAQTVSKGTVLTMPEAPTKEGYTFVGWYKDINGVKPFNFGEKITGNVSVYAKWVKN